ncbi:unnamed protein product [Kuraishia capsulata CBS 1993]|uniref:Uncharacterized protein n=1 Tax=Kuraishia capsulata CBS 1993 TaxID=1382522 RepID=W6MQL5_9ASCO|nr:uncharacterized protein KUCA_T00003530001 [Kuraishia capsulata CBS 1993]CDK27552.1 unnamed protein product [Kuraishia capsulata CBS 1993]
MDNSLMPDLEHGSHVSGDSTPRSRSVPAIDSGSSLADGTPPAGEQRKKKPRNRKPKAKVAIDAGSGSAPNPVNTHQNKREKVPPKFLELKKLASQYKPLTVNGIAVSSIRMSLADYLRKASQSSDPMYLTLILKPSDPDFAYDLDVLKLSLNIPGNYPFQGSKPEIVILNDDIPRGFTLNIEAGFKLIAAKAAGNKLEKVMSKKKKKNTKAPESEPGDKTIDIEMVKGNDLASMIMTLDKYLETFLAQEKRETIKIVRRKPTIPKDVTPVPVPAVSMGPSSQQKRRAEELSHIPQEVLERRAKEIDLFCQRFKDSKPNLYKDTSQNTILSLDLQFTEADFIVEIEGLQEFQIKNLPIRLYVPQEYLWNKKKCLRIEVALSNPDVLRMINTIQDKNLKLVFGKMMTNLGTNFQIVAMEFCKDNAGEGDESQNLFHSITSQLNFFISNVEKFLYEKSEFVKWNELRKQSNLEVLKLYG